jgi:predicted dehydrogenase
MRRFALWLMAALAAVSIACPVIAEEKTLKAGIVGCDTSHVIAFTDLINDPAAAGPLANVEITVAFPGGSSEVAASRDRLAGFVRELRERGVTIVDSIEAVVDQSDVFILASVDGRQHLEQFRAIARGKPVFIDKPAAASLADVLAIFRHADATNTPCFSASGLRFCDEVTGLAADKSIGKVVGCDTASPMTIEPHHPDLFWYGVHGMEALYTLMGTGCETIVRTDTDSSAVVVGRWGDGRIGSFRGFKQGPAEYAATVYGTKGVGHRTGFSGYQPLVERVCEFFVTGKPPFDRAETFEMFAFMEAADESKRLGGQPVALREIIERAEQQAGVELSPAGER